MFGFATGGRRSNFRVFDMTRRRYRSWKQNWQPARPANRCRALLIIDNRPLQAAAWTNLVQARKRLEKATRDVHRHEEVDTPLFRTWLTSTFPRLLSLVRALSEQ